MSRGEHGSAEKREPVRKLISDGLSSREVCRIVGCSNKLIRNAIIHEKKPEKRGRKRAMTNLLDNRLVRQAKKKPFKRATELKKDL